MNKDPYEDMWLMATIGNAGFTTLLVMLTGLPGAFGAFVILGIICAVWVWKKSKLASLTFLVVNIGTILAWDWLFSQASHIGPILPFLH